MVAPPQTRWWRAGWHRYFGPPHRGPKAPLRITCGWSRPHRCAARCGRRPSRRMSAPVDRRTA